MPKKSEERSQRMEKSRGVDSQSQMKQSQLSRPKLSQVQQQSGSTQFTQPKECLSQSMQCLSQSIMSKVETMEGGLVTMENEIQGKADTAERQKQNHSKLLNERDEFNFRIVSETKSQEAISDKYANVVQSFSFLGEKLNSVSFHMQTGLDIHNAEGERLNEFKEMSQNMQTFLETIYNTSIPSLIEHLELIQEKEAQYLLEADSDINCANTLKERELEFKMAEDNLCGERAQLSDLEKEILTENEESEQLENNEATLLQEREELKRSTKRQVEILSEKYSGTEHEVRVANEENGGYTLKIQNQQAELSQEKEREESLNLELEPMKADVECLAGTLSKKQTNSIDLEKLLDDETNNSTTLNRELDEIQLEFRDLERNISCRTSELSEEVSKLSASATEIEAALQEELNNEKTLEADILKEEENIQQSLVNMESKIQQMRDTYSEVRQSTDILENNLVTLKGEIVKLNEEEKLLNERSEAVNCAAESTKQSLIQLEAIHDECTSELENRLVCSEQEKCQAATKLESLILTEQELEIKIEEAKRASAFTDAEMKEHWENIVRELNEQATAAELEFQSMNSKCIKDADELELNLKHLITTIENKKNELNSCDNTVLKRRSDLEHIKISFQTTLELKEKQDKSIEDLISVISEHSQRDELQKIEAQSMSLKLEEIRRKLIETDATILSFEKKLQQLQSESEKYAADHKAEKQIFLRDLIKFQHTVESRAEDEQSLLKQKHVLTEKYANRQQELTEITSALQLKELEAKEAEDNLNQLKCDLQNATDKQLEVERALKTGEIEANLAKKKVDNLITKITAHKAAKKKEKENRESALSHRSDEDILPRQTTPKILASDSKETTPRSILKSSTKPTTPLKIVTFEDNYDFSSSGSTVILTEPAKNPGPVHKTVTDTFKVPSQDRSHSRNTTPQFPSKEHKSLSYDDDFDDGASSSSSIVMVPEITERLMKDPGAVHQIVAEHRERLRAKAEKKNHQEDRDDIFKIPSHDGAHSRNITPQLSSGRDISENTPGTSNSFSKPPQDRRSFSYDDDDDFDDGASSSSSIVMVPEITERLMKDPGAFYQIVAEHRAASAEKRKRRQQEMNDQALNAPPRNVTPSRNTTPQFVLDNEKENTPRSILKSSSKQPTPQKKSVKFVEDSNASSTSSAMMDVDLSAMTTPQVPVKRMKLSPWDDTNNEISSSTPEK